VRNLIEALDEAIAFAGETEECATAESALRWLLELAWADLQAARRRAMDGRWSMECDSAAARIVGLSRLVGPVSWEDIDVELVLDGLYERLYEVIGTPTPVSDDDRQQCQAILDGRRRPWPDSVG